MRHFPVGGITLVGYYGYRNLGDDLLLLSSLTLLEEIDFEGPVFLPAATPVKELLDNFRFRLNLNIIKRFDPFQLSNAVRNSCVTVFGGGNLLQDCTSFKSFLYYYELARYSLRKKRPVLLLSQGFGPINHRSNDRALGKLLNNPLTFGVMRDNTSYKHFSRVSKNVELGTDYGPYYLFKKGIIPSERMRAEGLAVIVLRNGTKVEDVIKALKLNRLTEVCAVGFHNHHDEEKRRELEEKARNAGFRIRKAPGDLSNVIEIFNNASIIITERLHGLILAISMGVPFVWGKNSKLDRFIRSIDRNCNLFFEDDCESMSLAINSSMREKPDFRELYKEDLERTVELSRSALKKLTSR